MVSFYRHFPIRVKTGKTSSKGVRVLNVMCWTHSNLKYIYSKEFLYFTGMYDIINNISIVAKTLAWVYWLGCAETNSNDPIEIFSLRELTLGVVKF